MRHPRVTQTITLSALLLSGCARDKRGTADSGASIAVPSADAPVVSTQAGDLRARWQVSLSGAGPLRVGMTLTEAGAALEVQLPDTSKLDRACAYVRLDSVPPGIILMWVEGRLARLDIDSASVPTDVGARVGDAESRVRMLYSGRFSERPHKYLEKGHYLVVAAPIAGGDSVRLVFESDGQQITRYRVGRAPEVEWVEGCA